MGDKTGIEWTATVHPDGTVTPGSTWNPVTGCDKVSPGCAHCYAETVAARFWKGRAFTDVQCHEDRLDQPLRWTKPRRVFVNSMSDLFHEAVPDAFIDRVFAVMALAQKHTFQVLTKRAEKMCVYLSHPDRPTLIARAISEGRQYTWEEARSVIFGIKLDEKPRKSRWPLPNVWLGVSVENQHFADERIPLLLQTPAAVRFISAEPLLGSVDLTALKGGTLEALLGHDFEAIGNIADPDPANTPQPPGLDWVIVGGESGKGARPFDVAWARSIVRQCKAAGVPVFVKQLGANVLATGQCDPADIHLRDRKGGDMAEWPADLRVREFPRSTT